MARTLNLADLAETVRWAYLAVNAAIPLPFDVAGLAVAEASPEQEHLMQLRETAFPAVLEELLGNDYAAQPGDLAALEQGRIPARACEGQGR